MKKLLLLFNWFCLHTICFGQKTIDNLIEAEKSFAAYSVANSTKEAFLKFLDSSGIVFVNGKPVNGIDSYMKREKRPGILNWYPQHAEISASGDFGYTTGPWTFQPKTINDTIAATGNYTTVWHINKQGEWRFLVDLGTNNNPLPTDKGLLKIERTNKDYKPGNEISMLGAEINFVKDLKKGKEEAYKKQQSATFCLLKRNTIEPAWSQDAYMKTLGLTPDSISYTILGSAIASSGDLGYVYGTTVINGKTDNYLRIWRKEKDGWKIAVEVLRY